MTKMSGRDVDVAGLENKMHIDVQAYDIAQLPADLEPAYKPSYKPAIDLFPPIEPGQAIWVKAKRRSGKGGKGFSSPGNGKGRNIVVFWR